MNLGSGYGYGFFFFLKKRFLFHLIFTLSSDLLFNIFIAFQYFFHLTWPKFSPWADWSDGFPRFDVGRPGLCKLKRRVSNKICISFTEKM